MTCKAFKYRIRLAIFRCVWGVHCNSYCQTLHIGATTSANLNDATAVPASPLVDRPGPDRLWPDSANP
ncbi:hypothetical protein TNCV_1373351 [Trichonephila clavipes]|uniref:Uncharacterized protein n=1 Tax=Trichonephila clavipes TaxID=2585209 RepID=A0A8X6WGS7_TRICX|nr:hypothetical protein TNCV_1373351 [Trichonephila clavipes]